MDETSRITGAVVQPDAWSLLLEFQNAMLSKEQIPDHVLQWLSSGLRAWVASGGKKDLARLLGFPDALKAYAEAYRAERDEEILLNMDLLVSLGARPEQAAAVVAESLEAEDALTEDTLVRKYKSKRTRASAYALSTRLAERGGARWYLARFNDTYLPESLLSMKRRG
jgi:hypothetical protein